MESVKGYVEHIIYRNGENGYTVMNMMSGREEIICVGVFRTIDEGETLEVKGNYVDHPVYGKQLKVDDYHITAPDDVVSMERYLSSGAIKGIGEALAARIIKMFGEDSFRIIEEEPERLSEVKGISERKAREIALQMEEKKDMREIMVFLQKYGISGTLAMKIYNTYGMGIYGILKENPYKLAEDIAGVGFKIADDIANKVGIHIDSDYRIRSAVLYVLLQATMEGHVYLPEEILLRRAAELLGVESALIEPQLLNLAIDRKIVIKLPSSGEETNLKKVYAATYYYEELNCAKMLHELNISIHKEEGLLPAEEERIRSRIKSIEKEQGIELDELQRKAVTESIKNGLFILTGGPGTGKTTTINTIIRYYAQENMDIFLAAPTGRAAKRMTETTGYEARTIHRLLELSGAVAEENKKAKFEKNEENPLEADVIIVDEMSMVDIHLFQSLLKAIMPGTRLVMAGDINQLPSVGPGQILKDLIDSQCFPVVMLQKIFRQAEESDIVINAHAINKGEQIELNNKSKDFFFLERSDVNVIYKHMVQLICEKLPPYVNANPYDIQVLTPMRKGSLGVDVLNGILQEYLNPPDSSKVEHPSAEGVYRVGDKVMQIKNNYQIEWEVVSKYGIPIDRGMGVFNGDIGVIKEINDYAQEIIVEFDEHRRVRYPFHQIDEIELAYAVTIHKSQGSEYPAVIMPLLSGPRMLFNRNLLYTGVTRAKNCVTILGSRHTVNEMIANENQNRRYTSLCERIRELDAI
ncbi:SF1B family DNA helicase RecD2 [Kineothrix sp. MB12-C1]|uniref:SF1B family DNA helicase RecD2 n=1 Tax=Kineothrix sp. MB12-C1 TaxID=3070215 RepID=UPI0027D25FFF|nr:ATP-dependent RecD-like DNA helicase [Kineothrix sp. MB12-C1]WMC91599.1 ATP-dependent RecD-like DNA helicase [Kineothrix sp. MB12-C1]